MMVTTIINLGDFLQSGSTAVTRAQLIGVVKGRGGGRTRHQGFIYRQSELKSDPSEAGVQFLLNAV